MNHGALLTLIPIFPFLAFLANGLFGRALKGTGAWLATAAMAASASISMFLLFESVEGTIDAPITQTLWHWATVGSFDLTLAFRFDHLTAVMLFVVTFVGALVFLYSVGYMRDDPGINRFFAYLSLFAFSMLILVLGDSFPLLFVGWEGVGLCSYLLIGYYMSMKGAPDAGKKAFIVNRIGDAGFLIAMFMIQKHFGTLNLHDVVERAPEVLAYGGGAVTAITLFMFLGCTGKSAQIPLFVWLPDAMAGPTPVSALIHAATMVTAGVYLVARSSVLFAMSPFTMEVVAIIGCLTAFVAGTIALTQRDIKKVFAYSTVSQLGYMFLACGVGAFSAGMFHVVTHAFFKALLFLGAGVAIHAVHGAQDLHRMGGLRKWLPIPWIAALAATLAISGFPLTAGFFSKDEILWKTFASGHVALYLIGVLTALMTVFYSFRAFFLAYHGKPRMSAEVQHHIHKPHWTMVATLVILAVGSAAAGYFNVPHVWAHGFGAEGANFERFLAPVLEGAEHVMAAHPADYALSHSEMGEILVTLVSVLAVAAGIAFAWRFVLKGFPNAGMELESQFPLVFELSRRRWWWDDAYNYFFAKGTWLVARCAVWVDRVVIDGLLIGTAKVARECGRGLRRIQTGQVQAYALALLIGVNILLLVILFS